MMSLVQKWVEALRSKRYKQCRGGLRNTVNEFCCLGVLCDVVYPEGWIRNPLITNKMLHGLVNTSKLEHNYPNHLFYFGPYYVDLFSKYASMNDNGKSFEEIADEIEKDTSVENLEQYLVPEFKVIWEAKKEN